MFSTRGRINRAAYWKGIRALLAVTLAAGCIAAIYASFVLHRGGDDGRYRSDGIAAVPLLLLGALMAVFDAAAGFCLAVRRLHDRGRSAWWMVVQLIPFAGSLWYFVETGLLAGTPGPNRFGPDPLDFETLLPRMAVA